MKLHQLLTLISATAAPADKVIGGYSLNGIFVGGYSLNDIVDPPAPKKNRRGKRNNSKRTGRPKCK